MATRPSQKGFLARHVPAVRWLRDYRWSSWLTLDVIAYAIFGRSTALRERDIEVRLARVHHVVLERLRASGALAELGEERVLPRMEDATAPR